MCSFVQMPPPSRYRKDPLAPKVPSRPSVPTLGPGNHYLLPVTVLELSINRIIQFGSSGSDFFSLGIMLRFPQMVAGISRLLVFTAESYSVIRIYQLSVYLNITVMPHPRDAPGSSALLALWLHVSL